MRLGRRELIVTHGPGQFMGELAQLSARPSLVDADAVEPIEALVIPLGAAARPDGAGGRARRAHHARADPAPRRAAARAGRPARSSSGRGSADVLRLEGFLARNGQPHRRARSRQRRMRQDADRALPRRSASLADRALSERQAAAQPERERAGALHRAGAADRCDQALRRRHRRRRAGRAGRGRLCGVRRPVGDRARLPRVRRPGGRIGAHRELSRLSDRHLGHGA